MANGRTIYLHIGTEKTGTTTLQAMFSTNRRNLEKAGILYPTVPGNSNHAGMAIYALPPANRPGLYSMLQLSTPDQVETYRTRFVADFSAELDRSDCKDIVISSEHMSSRLRQGPAIRRLVDMLGKLADQIKVIVYLRPQHELAPSSYSTNVKSGSTKPFRAPELESEYFYNYDLLTRNWEAQVGRNNVIARIFSRSAFKANSLIDDVFDAMSLSKPANLVIPNDKNTALAAHALEFMRVANGIVPRMLGNRINPDHMVLVRHLTALGPTPKFEIGREAAQAIESIFLASNSAVAKRYFPALNGRLFPPTQANEQAAAPPTAETMVRIGVDIWKSTRATAKGVQVPVRKIKI